ncbi:3',5'-cyclic-AMP phosphodiesterase [Acinetobacter pragensis]|uniref:3',5'-cyclic-AMP phosphodiesterase n=1 Tax=Acinetobacter pragensis TaxID=1806892 RepID=UPI0033410FAC
MPLSNHTDSSSDWTIVQISDTHLMDQVNLEFAAMNPEQSFHDVMQHMAQHLPDVDAVIHTGDLAQVPVSKTYERYLRYMQALGVPHFQIPGNHDDTAIFPFYRQQNCAHMLSFGNWRLILLNSAVEGQVDGWVAQEQLEQLERMLTEQADHHVLIACHHHPFAMQSFWIDQHRLKNADHLLDVIARHQNVKAVLYGHVHQDSRNDLHGVQFLSTPSTSVQFKPRSDSFALDESLPGYRVLHLNDNGEFSTEVIRVKINQPKINTEISGY